MHPMSFHQKRAHLCAVARGREMFAGVADMTPARFDILNLIYRRCSKRMRMVCGHEIEQAAVTRALGLSRQTVWKMVERLVELRLITRTKDPNFNARRNILTLTEEGVRRVRQAFGAAYTETYPLPPDAPASGPVPRYFRRLAETTAKAQKPPPRRIGREVARIYTAFVARRVRKRRRGTHTQHLIKLDGLIDLTREIAQALGDTSEEIYPLDWAADH
jgi:DNA-binding MarR family transcriptional regulator